MSEPVTKPRTPDGGKRISREWRDTLMLLPGYDPFRDAENCWFDEGVAELKIGFIEECCTHIEGSFAGRPFLLEPWEKAIAGNLFGWQRYDEDGVPVRRYRTLLLYIPRGNGKALALDTPIPTPSGWSTMGELREGDTVFDENGQQCTIAYATGVQYGRECYRVTFSDGASIVCDADHLWATHTRKPENGYGVRTTKEIAATLTVGNRVTRIERNHSVPVAGSLDLPEVDLPLAPYVLGAWLGDGSTDGSRLTCGRSDWDVVRNIEACGVSVHERKHTRNFPTMGDIVLGRVVSIQECARGHDLRETWSAKRARCLECERITNNARRRGEPIPYTRTIKVRGILQNLGVLGAKHIPTAYLRASFDQRLALLQGLMDTDGYCSKIGQCEFTTTKPLLASGVRELIASLGIKATTNVGVATLNGRACGEKYRVSFFPFADTPVFRLRRKYERQKSHPKTKPISCSRTIVSVEPHPSVPVKCIAVDSASHLYLAGREMIPTHNTPYSAGLCLTVLGTDNEPAAQIYGAAGETEQASLLFRHAKGMVEAEPELSSRFQIYTGYGQKSIQYPEQNSFYRVLSGNDKGRHGYNPHMVLIDELHVCSRDMVTALTSAFVKRGRKQPILVYITTADYERESVCNEVYNYGCKVRDGAIRDAHFLPAIWDLDRDRADAVVETPDGPAPYWTTEPCWAEVNPNLDVSVSREGLRIRCKEAQASPARENDFKRLNLNCKTEAISRWLGMDRWRACSDPPDPKAWRAAKIAELAGARPWAALDLGSTSDLTALALLFYARVDDRDQWTVLPYFWVPGGTIEERDPEYRALYRQWVKDEFVTPTFGVYAAVQDYDQVREDIVRLNDWFRFRDDPDGHAPGLAIDRLFQGDQLMTQLANLGMCPVKFSQTMLDFAAPVKRFEELVMSGTLDHGGNPVLSWMASNACVLEDNMGNKKPVKPKGNSPLKVDGIVATVMALGRAMADPDDGQGGIGFAWL